MVIERVSYSGLPARPGVLNNNIHGVLFDAKSMEDADDDDNGYGEEDDKGEDYGKLVEVVSSPMSEISDEVLTKLWTHCEVKLCMQST